VKGQFVGIKLCIGVSLLAAALWTGSAVGGVFAPSSITAAPANDNFANAIVLTGQSASPSGTNVDATLEPGENPVVAERTASHSVWYSWTPSLKGQVTIDTVTSDFDTLLGVYTGIAVNALTEVASDDDSGGDMTSSVTFNVTAGTAYRIRVDGFEEAAPANMGTVRLHLNEVLSPANDDFANAIVLPGSPVTRSGDTNLAATLEAGEDPAVAGSMGGASVWYRWTPAASGPVTIDTVTSDFDTLLGVYTGSTVGALVPVTSNDDRGCDVTSAVTFTATAATVYRIKVDGFSGHPGTINLHVAAGTATAPCAPTGVTATAGAGQATVSWSAPASDGGSVLTGYEVKRYVGGVAQGTTNVGVVNQATVSGLGNGTAYTFSVAAKNGTGTGPQSSASNAVIPRTQPDAPANVTATAGAGQATVSWSAPAFNGGSAITGYDVTSYVGGALQATTTVGVVTGATVSGLTNGTAYTFKVAAVNVAGSGVQSAASSAVTPRTVPDAPASVTASGGSDQATVSWAPAFDGGSAITGYDVTRYVGGVLQGTTAVGVVTQATVTGLTNGTTYTFTVAAKNAAGTGSVSAVSNAVTPRTVPGAPGNVSATAVTGQATISWTAPTSDGGAAISGYTVTSYVSGAAQSTTTVGVVTQTTVTGLTNGTAYTFRVAAMNAAGLGAQSADSNAVTPALPRFTLAVSKSGAGAGIVTSSAGGITCGTICANDFDAGTSLTLTAIAAAGSTFAGWSGACTGTAGCTLTIDAAKAATAAFNLNPQPQPPRVVVCTVPNVVRKTLVTAKRKIAAAHCRTGKVTRAKSQRVAKGRVISERPRAGRKLASGTKINLVVSRGKR
jgi:hypothetical protein